MKIIDKIKKYFAPVYCRDCDHCINKSNDTSKFRCKKNIISEVTDYMSKDSIETEIIYYHCSVIRKWGNAHNSWFERWCSMYKEKKDD